MEAITKAIREAARRLLTDKKVDAVIGWKRGTIPFMCEPVKVTDPEQVGLLTFDSFCGVNLANYVQKRPERLAVVAKGCDSRNLVIHIQEMQIPRERLYVLGVPCPGMLDKRALTAALKGREATGVEEREGKVVVTGRGFTETFDRAAYLQDNCRTCLHRNPVIADELMAEPVPEQEVDPYEEERQIEAMTPEERWKYFDELIAPCIRCYACRNACPLCYCPTCFVDESAPQWCGKTTDPTDTRTFHLLRAYHCAGRCTDCGACERACPVGIKVRRFTKKLGKDILELYGFEAGCDLEKRPPLDTYRPDDPNDLFR